MYSIKVASRKTGIEPVTIRAWERRYGVIEPKRTDAGFRLYTDGDIADLKWLKHQVEEEGLSISQAAKQLKQRKQELYTVSTQNIGKTTVHLNDSIPALNELAEKLHHAIDTFDVERADQLLETGFSMYPFDDLFHHVLTPLMHRIGDEWEEGTFSVAQEHFASHLFRQRLYQFFKVFSTNPNLPNALALCPPGENHEIGLLLFSLFLKRKGVGVIYLGANTPTQGLEKIIVENDIHIVFFSLTRSENTDALKNLILQLAEQFPELNIVLGGQGVPSDDEVLQRYHLKDQPADWETWFGQLSIFKN
ncbi:MerR family transcriptional regulator [Pseudalkalibacillus sp. Hm43]|uniref:MerR family transcriptional regulator n=1 Tax=Pseudalkalibacillus sp. Hm43 TaxID=3450742 RepID=UPI003F426939